MLSLFGKGFWCIQMFFQSVCCMHFHSYDAKDVKFYSVLTVLFNVMRATGLLSVKLRINPVDLTS